MSTLTDVNGIPMLDSGGKERIVRPRDKVRLAPYDPSKTTEYGYEVAHRRNLQLFGNASHVVAKTATWPCGAKALYLDNGSGVNIKDFIAVQVQ